MAASDQTYRSQRTLDVVFGVSCLLMLASVVGMFAQDYFREFKSEQRDFRDVEEALYQRQTLKLVPDQQKREEIDKLEQEVAKARADRDAKAKESEAEVKQILPKKVQAEARAQAVKADYDSIVSIYNIEIEKRDAAAADSAERQTFAKRADDLYRQVHDLEAKLSEAQAQADDFNRQLQEINDKQKEADKRVADAEDTLKKQTDDFNRFVKLTAQLRWKTGDWFRSLPVIDAFASPTRIQQYTLVDLPIDYSFKYVTRYDRCTTCHRGIDRPAFDKGALEALTQEPSKEEQDRLDIARQMLRQRADLLGDSKLASDAAELRLTTLDNKTKLSPQRVDEFCAHPHLDLFVEGKSPHPAEKFGCTICHGGQGSATDFVLAAHTPTDAIQKEDWIKRGWESMHFWDFPMLPARFVESSCLKCHHQVTDLLREWDQVDIRAGKKFDGPGAKVVRGYNLVRENGCFGCHEIAGIKGGRAVGPDLRLEPSPPLDEMSPTDRLKMLADPLNLPGNQRKVGPSLRRIAEKTNESWTRRWLEGPREFRPDTRMPHFYNLANNVPDALPDDQKKFPDTEIHSIAYYLFRESRDYLAGKDTARQFLVDRKKYLEDLKNRQLISEAQRRELEEVDRRLELARLPVPIKDGLFGPEGAPAQLPSAPSDDKQREAQIKHGRQLFTEKGCLACHSHSGTEQPVGDLPAVAGEANFGPNLSNLVAKIAPEDGDPDAKRRWLVQWIMNPTVHSPRTLMPVTHLEPAEASDVAEWLLSRPAGEWATQDPPAPNEDSLQALARVHLEKAFPRKEAADILAAKGLSPAQEELLKASRPDADELRLASSRTDEPWGEKLKWYIGKKAIGALGCFGCHEVPGFEYAKPVGTPLNDWGKKDPERLAFEDVTAYVKTHYRVTELALDEKGHGYAPEDGKAAYEKYFWEQLEHHQRDGFLYQKLREPRSYDCNRLRSWEDRLRMPQFKFARKAKPLEGETADQAQAREEAEAREAVMTFILGLVAEPVPLKYLNDPPPDRLAEAKGRQVIEKFNCAGCHQLRAGVYDFKVTQAVTEGLDDAFKANTDPSNVLYAGDNPFPGHNAWTGRPQAIPGRVTLDGLPLSEGDNIQLRLTEAARYTSADGKTNDIPAVSDLALPTADLVSRADPHGGTFTELLVPYLVALKRPGLDDNPKARSGLPPPLLREGEKAQPSWLFQFLKKPFAIRPVTILRMPRFNMSDEDAMSLVNYFAGLDRLKNPGVTLTHPYLTVPQRDEGYLAAQSQSYAARLGKDKLEQRAREMQPLWNRMLQDRTTDVRQQLQAAEANLQKSKDADKADATKKRDDLKAQLDRLEADARQPEGGAFQKTQRAQLDANLYETDGYRLLANYNLCLKCHQVGSYDPAEKIGPSLNLAPERLRPDWLQRWIASPQRLLVYPIGQHPMPQPFLRNKPEYEDVFAGNALEQATALRDVLMVLPQVSDVPANRYFRPSTESPK